MLTQRDAGGTGLFACRPTQPAPFHLLSLLIGLCLLAPGAAPAQGRVVGMITNIEPRVLGGGRGVEQAPGEKADWSPVSAVPFPLYEKGRVRTRADSEATLLLTNRGVLRLPQFSTLELPAAPASGQERVTLLGGAMHILSRFARDIFSFDTPVVAGAARGTEFLVQVEADGATRITVFDGEVHAVNAGGEETAGPDEILTITASNRPPVKTSVLQATREVQWWLYYPAILDPDDLRFTPTEREALASSLGAYRLGDLPGAFNTRPTNSPASDAARTYDAALWLAMNQPEKSRAQLAGLNSEPASALHALITAVTRPFATNDVHGTNTSSLLALSYIEQGNFRLMAARDAARAAAARATNFGFAWARLAELEFSLGHRSDAGAALERALALSPRHAPAHALRGHLLAARNQFAAAETNFNEAIRLDGHLGDAWLGRGLVRFRRGDRAGGRSDLLLAAGLEPERAALRSYLGKGFAETGDTTNAFKEFQRARELDPKDPTPSFYAALELNRGNRVNEAVDELERSLALNDHRQIFRSRLLLDGDRAVRSASLASIYRRAGLEDAAVREAARAVNDDYANYSAHQFLAESFDARRDPARVNLRYETPWSVEYLLATLLAPSGAGPASPHFGAQEYTRLFARDGLRGTTDTEVRSDGRVRELASQSGTFGGTDWALDLDWQHDHGARRNQDLSRLEWFTRLKQQVTPDDTALLLFKYYDYQAGDVRQTREGAEHPNLRVDESQTPLALAGWHHEWSPGLHTLFLGGRLEDTLRVRDDRTERLLIYTNTPLSLNEPFALQYRSELEIYTAELNQIWQTENGRSALVLGARYQAGKFTTRNALGIRDPDFTAFGTRGRFTEDFERVAAYAYETFEPLPRLRLTTGLAYDRVTAPRNFRDSPVAAGQKTVSQASPKLALVWTPHPPVTFRAAYARALGGASFDESVRLEPGQLAGFNQSHRTIISESVAGSVTAPRHELAGLAVDGKFATRTYAGLTAEWLESEVRRDVGVFRYPFPATPFPGQTRQELDYRERSLALDVSQLLGTRWSAGARWQVTRAKLDARYPEAAVRNSFPDTRLVSLMHTPGAWLAFNDPNGFFARTGGRWLVQRNNTGGDESVPDLQLTVGWRFCDQRGEISGGVVNALDRDHDLNPLTALSDWPRERVWFARLRLSF